MGSRRHRGTSTQWGRTISDERATSYGILTHLTPPKLVYLPPDGADRPFPGTGAFQTAKELTQANHVDCIFPGCGPYNHARGGTQRRHSFVHSKGTQSGDHGTGPETLDHLESKAALLAWIEQNYADHIEAKDLDTKNIANPTGRGPRAVRPDAWVKLTTGAEIAVEYQHSRGDFTKIREKTAYYAQRNITVWWIFSGRSSETCYNVVNAEYPSSYGTKLADLTAAQKALAKSGTRFFWFDREHRLMATAMFKAPTPFRAQTGERWGTQWPKTERRYYRDPVAQTKWVRLYEHNLEDCSIDLRTGDLITPGTRKIARDREAAREEITRLRERARSRSKPAAPPRPQKSRASELTPTEPLKAPSETAFPGEDDTAQQDNSAAPPLGPSRETHGAATSAIARPPHDADNTAPPRPCPASWPTPSQESSTLSRMWKKVTRWFR